MFNKEYNEKHQHGIVMMSSLSSNKFHYLLLLNNLILLFIISSKFKTVPQCYHAQRCAKQQNTLHGGMSLGVAHKDHLVIQPCIADYCHGACSIYILCRGHLTLVAAASKPSIIGFINTSPWTARLPRVIPLPHSQLSIMLVTPHSLPLAVPFFVQYEMPRYNCCRRGRAHLWLRFMEVSQTNDCLIVPHAGINSICQPHPPPSNESVA